MILPSISYNLIEYLESYSITTPIKSGENPATWMLNAIGAGNSSNDGIFDYSSAYKRSVLYDVCIENIDDLNKAATEDSRITFPSKYATSAHTQSITVYKRLSTIYWRSPNYNFVRLLVSGIVALLFGSVFAYERIPKTEGDMNSRVTSIYMSALFLGVSGMNTVLPVFEMERNMFYRHKASLMYDQNAINLAFTLVEIPFIMLSSMVFCLLWYFTVGFEADATKFFLYFLFVSFNAAIFTFYGQGLIATLPDTQTAQGFGSLFLAMNSIFGGILIRPQAISTVWMWGYWLFPYHYIVEGLVISQFGNDDTPIEASFDSPFYVYLIDNHCGGNATDCTTVGTAEEWVAASFGGMWKPEHIPYNVLYCFGAIVFTKAIAIYGLKQRNYLAT